MTTVEVYELTSRGGASDFTRLIRACELGPYCVFGDFAVNCYAEPIYTLDLEIVIPARFRPLNVQAPGSELRIQFTTDERHQAFLPNSVQAAVLGVPVKIASLKDVTQGKLWAYGDPRRRFSKRKKDELDLIRLAEAHPELKPMLPGELREQIERG